MRNLRDEVKKTKREIEETKVKIEQMIEVIGLIIEKVIPQSQLDVFYTEKNYELHSDLNPDAKEFIPRM
tara:strand:+ start:452 stop:658 length:207 start_codon:yes stop_codon:yes gene_type:complete